MRVLNVVNTYNQDKIVVSAIFIGPMLDMESRFIYHCRCYITSVVLYTICGPFLRLFLSLSYALFPSFPVIL